MRSQDRLRLAVIFLAISGMIFAGITTTESKEAERLATEHQASETVFESNALEGKIIVYYFHGTFRCPSCLQIEAWSFDAIQENFAHALEEEAMAWKTIDIDKPENRHFLEEYDIAAQALIIVEMAGKKQKRYKKLEKVWEYLSDQQAFYNYVTDEINKFWTGS